MTWVRRTSTSLRAFRFSEPFGPHPLLANTFLSNVRREAIAVGGMVALALCINIAVPISGLGEQDAARILNDVLIWEKSGALTGGDYRPKVMPLYLFLSRSLLELGLEPGELVRLLGTLNAVLGALILVPLHLIWRRLISPDIAQAAIFVVNLLPSFWVSHLYAFPHLPGLFLLVTALALTQRANDSDVWRGLGLYCAALALAAVAGGFKADLVLLGCAFPALLLFSDRIGARQVAFAVLIPAATVLFPLLLAHVLFDGPPPGPADRLTVDSLQSAREWTGRFSIAPEAFVSPMNLRIMLSSAGPVFLPLMLIGGLRCLFEKRLLAIALFIAAWALPAILFWGLREGNSSRHLMSSYVGIAPLVPIAVWGAVPGFLARVLALSLCCVLNYLSFPPSSHTVDPSTRLLASRDLLQARVDKLMSIGAGFQRLDAPMKLILGSWSNPYVYYGFLAAAEAIEVHRYDYDVMDMTLTYPGGKRERVAALYLRNKDDSAGLVSSWAQRGFAVWSWELHLERAPASASRPGATPAQPPRVLPKP